MSSKTLLSIFIVVLVAVVVGVGFYYLKGQVIIAGPNKGGATEASKPAEDPSPSGYQAVFLINNQVYFGKLSYADSQFPVLRDVYYLQVNQVLQPATDKNKTAQTVPDVSLIKLGGELHGPTDEMKINRDQILLIENLRSDSNVVRAIEEYRTNATKTEKK